MEAVRCIRLEELRDLVPIPYVPPRTRDMAIREANPLVHHSTRPAAAASRGCARRAAHLSLRSPVSSTASATPSRPAATAGATEKAYVHWTKRYVFFHGKRHLAEMGAAEVAAFLTSLADPFTVIYGTTQSDTAVLDTKRSAT